MVKRLRLAGLSLFATAAVLCGSFNQESYKPEGLDLLLNEVAASTPTYMGDYNVHVLSDRVIDWNNQILDRVIDWNGQPVKATVILYDKLPFINPDLETIDLDDNDYLSIRVMVPTDNLDIIKGSLYSDLPPGFAAEELGIDFGGFGNSALIIVDGKADGLGDVYRTILTLHDNGTLNVNSPKPYSRDRAKRGYQVLVNKLINPQD